MKAFVQNIKQKPEVVRKRIALFSSLGFTALVGIIWITTMASNGSFALAPDQSVIAQSNTTNDNNEDSNADISSSFSQLLGAVGAIKNGTTTKPALKIVDGGMTSTFNKPRATTSQATSIPF